MVVCGGSVSGEWKRVFYFSSGNIAASMAAAKCCWTSIEWDDKNLMVKKSQSKDLFSKLPNKQLNELKFYHVRSTFGQLDNVRVTCAMCGDTWISISIRQIFTENEHMTLFMLLDMESPVIWLVHSVTMMNPKQLNENCPRLLVSQGMLHIADASYLASYIFRMKKIWN